MRPLIWPKYNYHANVLNQYGSYLYEVFPEFQFVLYDHDAGEALAEGHTIPIALDGTTVTRHHHGTTLPPRAWDHLVPVRAGRH